jgi:hypothetical protein
MSAVITVEGVRFRVRVIPRTQLVSVWQILTNRPLPRVEAFQLENNDFDYVMRLRQNREDEIREKEEWGRVLSIEGTDACIFNADESFDADYVILIRENPYHPLEEVLKHELSHIAKGDL